MVKYEGRCLDFRSQDRKEKGRVPELVNSHLPGNHHMKLELGEVWSLEVYKCRVYLIHKLENIQDNWLKHSFTFRSQNFREEKNNREDKRERTATKEKTRRN